MEPEYLSEDWWNVDNYNWGTVYDSLIRGAESGSLSKRQEACLAEIQDAMDIARNKAEFDDFIRNIDNRYPNCLNS